MRYIVVILFLCISTAATAQKSLNSLLEQYNTRSIPYISVEELRMLQMNDSILILDTREAEEFNVSHIQASEFIGFSDFSSEEISARITKKDTPIVVYCSLGIRSEEIGEKLKKAGFTNIHNLYGGIFEWKNANFNVKDTLGNTTEKVHTFNKNWSKWLKKGEKVY